MSLDDDKPKVLPLPSTLLDVQPNERGGADLHELEALKRRIGEREHALAPSSAAEIAEAAKRRERMMELWGRRQLRLDAAVGGFLRGVAVTGIGAALYFGLKWLLADEPRKVA
jgi:hypothetical protein